MPEVRVTSFGGRSYMSANVVTDTNAVTDISLSFLPSVDRVRKARLSFDDSGVDGFEITIEFHDDAFEEFTVSGQSKQQPEGAA